MIPEAAVEAAVEAHCEGTMRAALEAAYPILLSHEREQTRLAHVDAVVNAASLSKYEALVDELRFIVDNKTADNTIGRWWAGVIRGAIDRNLQ